jgi:hypothetical protein
MGQGTHESTYVYILHDLARKYPMVSFVPEDEGAYEQGKAFWEVVRDHEQRRPPQFPPPLTNAGPQSKGRLHEALDGYVEHVKGRDQDRTRDGDLRLTAFGNLKVEQARRIQARQPDRPLSALDFHGCQELLDYWRLRPPTQPRHGKAARPMTKKTCENHVAELMRFFRWLHKSKDFAWRKPEDFDDLDTKVKDVEDERTRVGHLNVKVYTDDELALLNRYGTPLERLLLLLGLNCGFKGAEQGTLRLEHLFLDRPHPHASSLRQVGKYECGPEDRFLLYTRHKSGSTASSSSGNRPSPACGGPWPGRNASAPGSRPTPRCCSSPTRASRSSGARGATRTKVKSL